MTDEIQESDLECAFVLLCRGGNSFEELKLQTDINVGKYLLGFNSTVTFKIFNEIDDETTSRNASSENAPIDIQFGKALNPPKTKLNLKETLIENDGTNTSPSGAVTPFLGGGGFAANTANFVEPVTTTERKPADPGPRRDSFAFTEMKSDSKEQSADARVSKESKESEADNYVEKTHLADPVQAKKFRMAQ